MQFTDHRSPSPQSHPSQAHPSQAHLVVFRDQSARLRYLTRSTRTSEHTTTWEDGNIYPVVEVDLSSAAHFASKEDHGSRSGRRKLTVATA